MSYTFHSISSYQVVSGIGVATAVQGQEVTRSLSQTSEGLVDRRFLEVFGEG